MLVYLYSLIPLLFLPADSSSIRDRNFRNDLVPFFSSRLDSSKKDANSLKIVSDEPFIIQVEMPRSGGTTRGAAKDKDTKRKRPTKKRVSKLKPLRKRRRQRRDLQSPKADVNKERKSEWLEISKTGKIIEHQPENTTISKADILNALSSYTRKRETKKGKQDVQRDDENGTKMAKDVSSITPDGDTQRFSPPSLVKMVYPSAPKSDKNVHKYSYKDLKSDRERLEKKIKYIRNMMNLSAPDDAVRVRRRSESDRTANKIAKMFLTLSAVNGLHDRMKSKCDDYDSDDNDGDGYRFWEKENQENPLRRSSSSNEERYKVKKWIEHMKNKRSSSKTCPCLAKDHDEEKDVFPLEQKLPKNYYLIQRGGGSEESSEAYGDPSYFHRDKLNKSNHKRRNHKAREDNENKLKAVAGKGKKLELPLDDLEVYRLKAKQILQNAEEILDKIKEEEERRLSTPNLLVSQLKELTSRIQTDPRNNENDLIRKIQKTLGLGPAIKSSDGPDGSGFLENVKSFILDPYEKAKALTDESTKKLSSYLLRNLGELQESGETKEGAEDKGNVEVYFGQVPQKEEEKPHPANLAKEKPADLQPKEGPQAGVSFSLGDWNDNGKKEDSDGHPEDQFRKRMEEIIKEQEKKLSGFEVTQEPEDSPEYPLRTDYGRNKQGENARDEETPLQQRKGETRDEDESVDNYKTGKVDGGDVVRESVPKESDYVLEKEATEGAEKNGKEKTEQEVLKEILTETEGNEKHVESDYKRPIYKEEEEPNDAKESSPPGLDEAKLDNQHGIEEVVAAATPEEPETHPRVESNAPDFFNSSDFSSVDATGADEKTQSKKPDHSEEDKSVEGVSEGQKDVETDTGKNPADDFKTPGTEDTVALSDSALTKENEWQTKTDQDDQTEKTQREAEPEADEGYLLKEAEPDDESLPNKNEKVDEAREQQTLETPVKGHERGEKNTNDQTPPKDQSSKAGLLDEDQVSVDRSTKNDENPREEFSESKKEVQDTEEERDESSLVSATSKESSQETSGQHSDEGGDEVSQKTGKSAEKAENADESETFLKEANREMEETRYSAEEDASSSKAALNDSSIEKDLDEDVDDQNVAMTATSEEGASEKLENPERSNEALMKSDRDRYDEEANRQAPDPSQDGNDDESESREVDKEIGDKPVLTKSTHDLTEADLESGRAKNSNEIISEDQKENSFHEGDEFSSKASNLTEALDRETQNLDNEEISDVITKDGNFHEISGSKTEDQDKLLRAQNEQENFKDKPEKLPFETSAGLNERDEENTKEDATAGDGALKAPLETEGRENFEAEESHEEVKMTKDSLKGEARDESKDAQPVLDDETVENEDVDDETSLKAANSREALDDNSNAKEEDDEAASRETLADQIEGTTGRVRNKEAEEHDDTAEEGSNENDRVLKDFHKTPLKAALSDEDLVKEEQEENKNEETGDDFPLGVTANKTDENSFEVADDTSLKANRDEDDEGTLEEEETDETSLKAIKNKDDESTPEEEETDETSLKAIKNKDDESTLEEADETPVRAVNIDESPNDSEENKHGEKVPGTDGPEEDDLTVGADGQTFSEETSDKSNPKNNALDDETSLRAENVEAFGNNVYSEDETPLRASADHLNPSESFTEDDDDENMREANIPDEFSNQIDGHNDDKTPLKSVKSFHGRQEESEEDETLKSENPAAESGESPDSAVSAENKSSLSMEDPIQSPNPQKDTEEEIRSEDLQEHRPRGNSLKKSPLKVPSSIARIMKDLEGQEKDDLSTIENLNPEKIDYIIDKIDEVEQQNKVTDEVVDCRKECACAEDINTRSRNIGRYEIAKDFLRWMKDLQLNRVLSDD